MEKNNSHFKQNDNAGNDDTSTNDFKHENSIDESSDTQNVDRSIDKDKDEVDISGTLNNNRDSGQDEIIGETTEDLTKSNDIFETNKLYDQRSEETFPRICMDGMNGSMIDMVGNYVTSFSSLHSALSALVDREGSTAATTLFNIVDSMGNITGSTSSVFWSLIKTLPKTFNSITEVVAGLNIETLATQLPGTMSELRKLLMNTIQIVNEAEKLKADIVKKLNTAITLVAKSVQGIVNTINIIAEGTRKAIGSVSTEVQEAVISLTFVLATVLVIIQSIFASMACVLSPLQVYSLTLDTVLVYVDRTLKSIIGVITSTDYLASGQMSVAIGVISMTFAYLSNEVNPTLDSIMQSSDELDFAHSLEELLHRLSEVIGANISSSISNSITLISSSLNLASAGPYSMLAKVADQISLVYKGLSRVIGTDSIILTVMIHSSRSIFETILSALNYLQSGIGVEATEALKRFTGNVQLSLKSLLSLLRGLNQENVNIAVIVKEIGKSLQYVVSAFDSIASTISEAINDINVAVVEAVLSLPFICSAVLYVSQWVLSVAVSIFNSIAGSVSEILLSLTILTSATLDNISRITSMISTSLSDSLENIFHSIMPLVGVLTQLVTSSYAPISGNVVNIVFNLNDLLAGAAKQNVNSVSNLLHSAKGSVPVILNSLTGKLISISPELSSTLFSLNNSLKSCSTSDSKALKVISNILILVLTDVTKVTGSASEILSLISSVLGGAFNNLSNVVSKFSVLGDVSVSLNVSVSNIHNALHSLIETVNDCSTDLGILVDPVRNVAKTTQILISTFFAIFNAVSQADKDIARKLSEAIINLPYIVSAIILVGQYVLGAAIAKLLVTFGNVPTVLQQLALALSAILQRITSIVANITSAQSVPDVNYSEIISQIVKPVTDFNSLTSSSLSVISLVLANINVSLGVAE